MHMDLLWENLPETVSIDNEQYLIYTDFRRWVRLEHILFEQSGPFIQKISTLLTLCYQTLPPTLEKAIDGMISFYEGPTYAYGKQPSGQSRPIYSFVQDEALIYAAFYQQYGINLAEADLHWWRFKALMQGISEQTQLARVMMYRSLEPSQIHNPKEKQYYRRMKELYRLQDRRSDKEREHEISAALASLF